MSVDHYSLDRISRIPDPERRLCALQTYTLAAIADSNARETPGTFPLHDALHLTLSACDLLKGRLPTPDASTFPRGGFDPLFCGLSGFVFLRFGNLALADAGGRAGCTHVADDELGVKDRSILDQYFRLLQDTGHWRTSIYARRQLHQGLHRLPAMEQREFEQLCDSLAAMLRRSLSPPLPRNFRRTFEKQLDRAVELRTLAMLAGVDDGSMAAPVNRGDIAPGVAGLFFIRVAPTNTPCYGCVAFERDRTHLWWSADWSACVQPLALRLSQINFTRNDLDADVLAILDADSTAFNTIMVDGPPPNARISHVVMHDHTTIGLPLACLLDVDCRRSISSGGSLTATSPLVLTRATIAFWGDLKYGRRTDLWANDSSRTVMHGASSIMSYPAIPPRLPRFPEYPEPLPFGSYERWFFEDLSRERGISVLCHHGAQASRDAFLDTAVGHANVLHVSTHGEADSEKPDLSRLLFCGGEDGPTYVLLLDILARDWSQYDLVFLNACPDPGGSQVRRRGGPCTRLGFPCRRCALRHCLSLACRGPPRLVLHRKLLSPVVDRMS